MDSALSGVVAPAGRGEIRFWFHSNSLAAGAELSAAALLALGICAVWPNIRGNGSP